LNATGTRLVEGFSVSVITGSLTANSTLYISTSNTTGSRFGTYAIPLVAASAGTGSTAQLRSPFSTPLASPLYVQVVSSSVAAVPGAPGIPGFPIGPIGPIGPATTVVVELQLLTTPING
jgi:hypothetical protein